MRVRARRTDFGRFRAGGGWFAGGRSLPTTRLQVGWPDVFTYLHGMRLALGGQPIGIVNAIWYPAGAIWVTP